MSNKSWSKLPSRGGNGCRGMEEPKWHFGICYSTFNRLRTLTCHPSSSWASEVKGERQHAVGHCFCLPHYSLRGTRANQHPAKCSVIGCVYSVLAWFHAWLDCRIPFEEKGLPLLAYEIVCTWVGRICIFRAVCVGHISSCMCGTGVRCHKGCQMRKCKSFVCNHGSFSPQSNLKTGHRL